MFKQLIVILSIISVPVFGQNSSTNKDSIHATKDTGKHTYRFDIGGQLGYGMPTEAYGRNTQNAAYEGNVGFADRGICFQVNFNCLLSKHFGFFVDSKININGLDNEYFEQSPYSQSSEDGQLDKASGGTYFFSEFLTGPYYSKTFINGNILEINLISGLVILGQSATNETFTAKFVNGNYISYNTFTQSTPSHTNVGGGAELSIKYEIHLVKSLYLSIATSYLHVFTSNMFDTYSYYGSNNTPIGIANGTVGIDYKF